MLKVKPNIQNTTDDGASDAQLRLKQQHYKYKDSKKHLSNQYKQYLTLKPELVSHVLMICG